MKAEAETSRDASVILSVTICNVIKGEDKRGQARKTRSEPSLQQRPSPHRWTATISAQIMRSFKHV